VFSARDASAFFWMLFTAALSLAVGIMLVWKPADGTMSLTLVLMAFFLAEGAFQIGASLSYRDAMPNSWAGCLRAEQPISCLQGLSSPPGRRVRVGRSASSWVST
jgi:uncharacterized membrane protein HdeD (DUF308 family)